MSTSSLLPRRTMNGCIDDQNGSIYHHLSRDISNFAMLSLEDRTSSLKSHSHQNLLHESEHNYHPGNALQENLYSNQQLNGNASVNHLIDPSFDDFQGNASRKSVNMTETVSVPSSEHVAEIVGRQGNYF